MAERTRWLTKHFTNPRRERIQFVVVHHSTIVGHGDGRANDSMWNVWQNREASAHYGVDGDDIMQFVRDSSAAWATGNSHGNHAGISIEHANATREPSWRIDEKTWRNGARLAARLHIQHGLGRPVSTGNGSGGTLRKHRSFTSTACPGPFMDSIWDDYVTEAQREYDRLTSGGSSKPSTPKPTDPLEEIMSFYKDKAEFEKALYDVVWHREKFAANETHGLRAETPGQKLAALRVNQVNLRQMVTDVVNAGLKKVGK